MTTLPYILASTLILLTTASLRLLYILPAFHRRRPPPRKRGTPTHLLIVLGSGGHTAEMLALLTSLDPADYTYRSYVIGSGDDFSADRAHEFERGLALKKKKKKNNKGNEKEDEDEKEKEEVREQEESAAAFARSAQERKETPAFFSKNYSIHTVPRARQIHQSLLTSPLSSLRCLFACLKLLHGHRNGHPDLILTNGPATSLIMILAATILRYFFFLLPLLGAAGGGSASSGHGSRGGEMRVIYVESWARVKRPSLSGRIIVWCGLCDRVLVQWKGLQDRGWGEYRGVLVR